MTLRCCLLTGEAFCRISLEEGQSERSGRWPSRVWNMGRLAYRQVKRRRFTGSIEAWTACRIHLCQQSNSVYVGHATIMNPNRLLFDQSAGEGEYEYLMDIERISSLDAKRQIPRIPPSRFLQKPMRKAAISSSVLRLIHTRETVSVAKHSCYLDRGVDEMRCLR